jgi:hypothetical protein
MMTPWIDFAIEGLVAVLLVLTIGYCILLDGRLKRLRADEANLRATISELITATEIAERAIYGLKETAQDCDRTLAQRLREAEFFSQEIEKEIGEGEKLLNRIIRITQAAQGAAAASATASVAHVAPSIAAAEAASDDGRNRSRLGELRARVNEATTRLGQMKARGAAA